MSYTPGPLPKPYAHHAFWPEWDQWHDSADPLPSEWDDEPPTDVVLVFTASQMQTHTAAEVARAVAAERDRLAEVVRDMYREAKAELQDEDQNTWYDGYCDGLEAASNRLRADPQRLQGKGE